MSECTVFDYNSLYMIANSTASDSPAIGIAIKNESIRRHSMIKVLLELLVLNVVSLSCLLD